MSGCSPAHGWVRVVCDGGRGWTHRSAHADEVRQREGVFMWKKVRIGVSCMEGALFIYRYRRPRLCICSDGFIVLSVSTEVLTFHFFFHTVQPEVCLSADKEFLHTSIVFFIILRPLQTSPPFSFCGCTGGKTSNQPLISMQSMGRH